MVRLHKSIPSPRSSCAPHWNTPINQSHYSHPASVAPPCRVPANQSHLFDPVAPPWRVPASVTLQWRAPSNQSHLPDPVVCPMMYPINQSHRPDPARVACPTAHPHKSIPSPWSSQCRVPPWQAPPELIPSPCSASAAHHHKSTLLPHSSQCCMSPWNNSIAPIQPVSHIPMIQSHRPEPASEVRPMACPDKSILLPRSSQAPP